MLRIVNRQPKLYHSARRRKGTTLGCSSLHAVGGSSTLATPATALGGRSRIGCVRPALEPWLLRTRRLISRRFSPPNRMPPIARSMHEYSRGRMVVQHIRCSATHHAPIASAHGSFSLLPVLQPVRGTPSARRGRAAHLKLRRCVGLSRILPSSVCMTRQRAETAALVARASLGCPSVKLTWRCI